MPVLDKRKQKSAPKDEVAIIGMACMFPKAPDLKAYWQNIVSKVSAISDPPKDWEAERYFNPSSKENDQVYCKRGGYLGDLARFDPFEFGVMPSALDGGEPDHYLALRIANEALLDAGYSRDSIDSERTEVIIGRGTYINRGVTNIFQHGVVIGQTIQILQTLHPEYTKDDLQKIREHLKGKLPPFNPDIVPSCVPNVLSGRIANRLNLMGTNYLVDAACASSLIAVEHGISDLLSGKCDLALAGGVNASIPPPILMIFSQIDALSRNQALRPFDEGADGTMLGEGLGVIVLKRKSDAERDGDRIYAVLKGVGVASDGTSSGLLAPRQEGQVLAMKRAYEAAAISPESVELIEAHGTGIALGDITEIESLCKVFGIRKGAGPRCAIGTVKSMIGHLIPASGIASLIKTALALYHKVLPPTLNCDTPNPKLGLEKSPFYINTETRPWIHGDKMIPRRAGVNAFGFGGINAHAILEEYKEGNEHNPVYLHQNWNTEIFLFKADSRPGLIQELNLVADYLKANPDTILKDLAYTLNTQTKNSSYRMAIVGDSAISLSEKVNHAVKRLTDPACSRIREKSGIYFFEEPLAEKGKVAFLFPGEGSQYENMFSDLCLHFPEVRAYFDVMDRAFIEQKRDYLPSQTIFPLPLKQDNVKRRLWDMDAAAESVSTANQALKALLDRLDIRADILCGHSTGEYSALIASGMLEINNEDQLISFIRGVNDVYETLVKKEPIPQALLLSVGMADRESALSVINDTPGLYVAMDNCPHQIVLCGKKETIEQVAANLQIKGAVCEVLSFDRPYHTPLFKAICSLLKEYFSKIKINPPKIETYSCISTRPYPKDANEIRELATSQWARAVRFRETIENMYDSGARIFIEVGPRGNLTAFVDDILKNKPYLAVAANLHRRSGIDQINHMVGLLYAHHVRLDPAILYKYRAPLTLSLEGRNDEVRAPKALEKYKKISLVLPRIELDEAFPQKQYTRASPPQTEPGFNRRSVSSGQDEVMMEYLNNMERFINDQQEIMRRYLGQEEGSAAPLERPGIDPKAKIEEAASVLQPVEPMNTRKERLDVEAVLLDVVSEKTGYPKDMLGLDANIESELGIDSIKRVEILGEFRKALGSALSNDSGNIFSGLGTFREIITAVQAKTQRQNPEPAPFPFIRKIKEFLPGKSMTALCNLNLGEDRFLKDHTLGGNVSEADPELIALPIVPLTFSMEILAEAAACLMPGKKVVGMREVRAYRWIGLDEGKKNLEITARALTSEQNGGVEVKLYDADESVSEEKPRVPIVESIVLFGETYPQPPLSKDFALKFRRPSKWKNQKLYNGFMFHGPALQGVASMDEWGENGSVATLQALPKDKLFGFLPDPGFLIDPVVLDAAGQVIGYWTTDHLERAFHVFPFRLEELQLFDSCLPVTRKAACRASIALVEDTQVRSDIDIIDSEGRLRARLIGWWDKRFDLPDDFFRLRSCPRDGVLSASWPAAIKNFGDAESFQCCALKTDSYGFLNTADRFWERVLAYLVLNSAERITWRNLSGTKDRRGNWLFGRIAAKDALRLLLKKKEGVDIYPADIEIETDKYGKPGIKFLKPVKIAAPPSLSIAHTKDIAVAIAGYSGDNHCKIGVDVERLRHLEEGFAQAAFSPEERILLSQIQGSDNAEWVLRLWCAKEALGKALGRGLGGRPQDLQARNFEYKTGIVRLEILGNLAQEFPRLRGKLLQAYTLRQDDLIVASVLLS